MTETPRPRSILLAVTGMSPQVVTETLYALATDEKVPFIPDEVHIITTAKGREKAILGILEGQQLEKLKKDYPQLRLLKFDETHIHVFHDGAGVELENINTLEGNFHAADTMLEYVRQFTNDEECSALHVSIAGGYKQMSFYMGYIFSLFARPQDRLSHVLVNHPFDNPGSDFYFKPRKPKKITVGRDAGGKEIKESTEKAEITLVPIPIVHLGEILPKTKKGEMLHIKQSYRDTVAAIQQGFEEPHLSIDLRARRTLCGGIELNLRPIQVTWLAWWAQQAQQEQAMHGWRELDKSPEMQETFLAIYERVLKGNAAHLSEADQATFSSTRTRLQADCQTFFRESNSKLETTLKEQLGPAARHYLLATSGTRPHTTRGLTLAPSQIELAGLD